jgi:hypothetical protein
VLIGLAAILVLVAALHALPLLAHEWPLGDGGLFYAIIGDLLQAGFEPPAVVS